MDATIKFEADNTVLTDLTKIASKYNKYFSLVTEELTNNFPQTTISPLENMSQLCNTSTSFETGSQEVSKLIKSSKSRKKLLNK